LKVKILKKKENHLSFLLEGVTPAFANALRRIMISEIPVLAVDSVIFEENGSVLFDEVLAHRMAMIPLKFDPEKFVFQSACKCGGKGCPSCQVVFAVEKAGPAVVYSGDFKSTNKAVTPVEEGVPIVKLLKGQRLKAQAIAKLGIGRDHAKFHAANAAYQYYPEIEVLDAQKAADIPASICPTGVLSIKGKSIEIKNPAACDICRACEQAVKGAIKLKADGTRFIFNIESVSGLKPKDIVMMSADVLNEKAKEFEKLCEKL
jgi:DNA-directed RNA polymerase subunit D